MINYSRFKIFIKPVLGLVLCITLIVGLFGLVKNNILFDVKDNIKNNYSTSEMKSYLLRTGVPAIEGVIDSGFFNTTLGGIMLN